MCRDISTIKILKRLTAFSLPLILSGLLQQLFNWVDALIVGNVVGEAALAGIGAISVIYNLLVMVIVGFTSGLTVLFARQYGSGKTSENAKLLANHSVLLTVIFAVVSVLGAAFVQPVLELMDTPAAVMDYAKTYLLIILIGIPFLALYNVYSAALRGIGNSTTSFIAVVISSIVNAGLDYVFVAVFRFGVAGAAVATVISQAAMTVYVVAYSVKNYPELCRPTFKLIQARGAALSDGIKFGMPPAVQSSISSAGDLVLQRFMNGFGEQTVAAITTAYRIDTVLCLPISNFSTAISTLVAQETGAGHKQQAKIIFKLGSIMMAVISLALMGVVLAVGKPLLAMFGLTSEAVAIGNDFFRALAAFYIVHGMGMSVKAYLEGVADMVFSGAVGICSLVVRIICSYLFVGVWGTMVIAYAEAISWVFALLIFAIRYLRKR